MTSRAPGTPAHALGVYRRLLGAQIRSQMQYRTAFLLDLLATALVTVVEFGAVVVLLRRFGDVRGWTLVEVAFLYGLVETSFNVMDTVFSGFDPPIFGLHVRRGTFDRLLLRPVPLIVQVLGSDLALRRLGRVALGLAIWIFALVFGPIQWTVARALYLPVVALSLVAFFGGLFIAGSTITFWTIESIEGVNIFTYGTSAMISYPTHIYQDWLRRFFTYVLPAVFLSYTPALFILGKADPLGFPPWAPFLAPVVGAGVLLLSLAFWRFGVRHYQSTGT